MQPDFHHGLLGKAQRTRRSGVMRQRDLVRRGLTHYWRTNAAVVAGVAAAVTVLSGALLVGDSVRGSLRDLVLRRLGATDLVVLSSGFFRARLADDLRGDSAFGRDFSNICPVIAVPGVATDQASGRRASRVQVYGVDDRFWAFHGSPFRGSSRSASRDVLLSPALARELGTAAGGTVLLRLQPPQVRSLESDGSLIDHAREEAALGAARELHMQALPVFTYLANSIRSGTRQVPYSLVTAFELSLIAPDVHAEETSLPPIVLN